jgi:4-diphosphocytidyl-2-C-methyl-D-erythritol kinase
MIIERLPHAVRILAPAKVNLFLEVMGKRPDGYHEIETVLCPISLFDTLTFEVTDEPEICFELQLPADANGPAAEEDVAWSIPTDHSNLAVRALQHIQRQLGARRGCRLKLEKQIPAAAGLGGGSSDTAAAVVASLIAWDRWDRQLATQVCASIGSDVPFFLGDLTGIGMATAIGRGEQCQQIQAQPELSLIVTHPPIGCSTKLIYDNFSRMGPVRHFGEIVSACETGQFQKIGARLFNALQSPASRVTEWIDRQLNLFASCGAEHSLMTGSGSSCFALVNGPQIERKIKASAAAIGLRRVFSVEAWYGDSIEQQLSAQVE